MDVSIALTHSIDEYSEYNAITSVHADILFGNDRKKIGKIDALIINRQIIPAKCFWSVFDGHSQDLQFVGCALMEIRYGRTQLKSLAEYDDPEFDFMYISTFHVDDEYKQNGASDVATKALHQFLHHPVVSGQLQFGCWRVSSVAYVLDPCEAMTKSEVEAWKEYTTVRSEAQYNNLTGQTVSAATKQAQEDEKRRWNARLDVLSRQDANPFLRNGFFQDEAIAKNGGSSARILVASHGHFRAPLKSHAEALAVSFCTPPQALERPTGKNAELFDYVKASCTYDQTTPRTVGAIASISSKVQDFIRSGASVSGSHSIHAACANNDRDMVKLLLELEPVAINAFDAASLTPLMVAASNAAGRMSRSGLSDSRVLDYLLARGADKAIQDRNGMTAYGHFRKQSMEYTLMLQAMTGGALSGLDGSVKHASEQVTQDKLMPPGGPSPSDLTGGKDAGIMVYSDEEDGFDSDGDY